MCAYIEIEPDYANAWNNRGFALHKLDKYQEALTSYDKAIEIQPN
ncbi:MAG: tetratricopeptide repeat protein [Symploca sp. SIO2E6]|nr:tetratricopeptide repeat protein [Symploca sp. SIO2E6]